MWIRNIQLILAFDLLCSKFTEAKVSFLSEGISSFVFLSKYKSAKGDFNKNTNYSGLF